MSSRYDAPGAQPDVRAEDESDDPLTMWRALDEGRDPTERTDP